MPNLAMLLEYDGTAFAGWQRQREGQRTVQATVEAALSVLGTAPVRCVGAGRTDAGVHACGQVATGHCETVLDPSALWRALNALLPRDVSVRALARVPDSFHARRDAAGKHYVYRWWAGATRSPLRERTHHWVPRPLQLDAMSTAAHHFIGTHDFACLQAAGSATPTTVRTLGRVELKGRQDGTLRLDVEGDGFLRHMVRNLAGTLLEVGLGGRRPDSIPPLLESRNRSRAGATAPAHGLLLQGVQYDPPIPWEAGAPVATAKSRGNPTS